MDHEYVAAWVPFDDMPDVEKSSRVAAAWLVERSRASGIAPLLVLPDARVGRSGPEAIQRLAKRVPVVTPRSSSAMATPRCVLAYAVDYKELHLAAQCAHGGALVAVEWPTDPLIGWAMERRALNLAIKELTADTRPAETTQALEHLHWAGNNGWTTAFDKQVVPRLLAEMRAQGLLDRDVVCGYMLARGHSAESIKNLTAMMSRL